MPHARALTGRLLVLGAFVMILPARRVEAQGPLGAAQQFGVLAGASITNTGATTVNGNIGVWPGSAITGLGAIVLTGTVHQSDAVARQAQASAAAAFTNLAAMPFTTNLSGQDLGGLTLTPGVYFFSSSAQLTGTLVLDFLGNAASPFVFQIGSTLTTAAASVVSVLHGGTGSGIYWQVGSSATLGVGTLFAGNLIADQNITLTTGARIHCGRAIALNGAVTLDSDDISNSCADGSDFGSLGFSGGATTTVPEPSTTSLLATGCGLLFFFVVRRERRSRASTRRHES